MDKSPREAQRIDREAVKTLAIAIGVREAARKLGLNQNTVVSWSKRDNWFGDPPKPQSLIKQQGGAISAIKQPSSVLRDEMADDSKATKIGFSRAARKVAMHLRESPVEALVSPATALAASKWHGIASDTHQWNAEQRGSGVLAPLTVYSGQTVIQVGKQQ